MACAVFSSASVRPPPPPQEHILRRMQEKIIYIGDFLTVHLKVLPFPGTVRAAYACGDLCCGEEAGINGLSGCSQ